MHALAKEILDDKTPTLREKLLRFCGPMLDDKAAQGRRDHQAGCGQKGCTTPKLVRAVLPRLVAPILELHRENLRLRRA